MLALDSVQMECMCIEMLKQHLYFDWVIWTSQVSRETIMSRAKLKHYRGNIDAEANPFENCNNFK